MPDDTPQATLDIIGRLSGTGTAPADPGAAPTQAILDRLAAGESADEYRDRRLGQARQRVAAAREGSDALGSASAFLSTHSMPFVSDLMNRELGEQYKGAKERVARGAATEDDYTAVAGHEYEKNRAATESLGRAVLETAGSLPALLGETAVAGGVVGRAGGLAVRGEAAVPSLLTRAGLGAAVRQAPAAAARQAALTPATPSVWLERSQESANRKGGDWYDPENVVPALAYGALQNAVLGSTGKFAGRAPGGLAGRAAAGGVIMPLESAAADTFAGVVDDTVMPDAYKLNTRYGTLGQIARGETDDALKRIVVEALTGASFSAFHGKDHGPQLAEVHAALKDAADAGATRDEAAKTVAQLLNRPATIESDPTGQGGVLGRRIPGDTVSPQPEGPPPTTYGETPPVENKGPLAAPAPEPVQKPAEPPIPPPERPGEQHPAYEAFRTGLDRSAGLTSGQRDEYQAAVHQVLGSMPKQSLDNLHANVKEVHFFPDNRSVAMAAIADHLAQPGVSAADRAFLESMRGQIEQGRVAVGRFAHGKLFIDGGEESFKAFEGKYAPEGGGADKESIYAHELTHAIDGPGFRYSTNPDGVWRRIYQAEIADGQLSEYARRRMSMDRNQSPAGVMTDDHVSVTEGFAEFGRLVYGSKVPLAELEKAFPKATLYFKKNGLLPEGRPERAGAKPTETFTDRVGGDAGHIDVSDPAKLAPKPSGDTVSPEPKPSPLERQQAKRGLVAPPKNPTGQGRLGPERPAGESAPHLGVGLEALGRLGKGPTAREEAAIRGTMANRSLRDVADELGVSHETVRGDLKKGAAKLGADPAALRERAAVDALDMIERDGPSAVRQHELPFDAEEGHARVNARVKKLNDQFKAQDDLAKAGELLEKEADGALKSADRAKLESLLRRAEANDLRARGLDKSGRRPEQGQPEPAGQPPAGVPAGAAGGPAAGVAPGQAAPAGQAPRKLTATQRLRNLVPDGPGDTLDRAVMDFGGIDPSGDAFTAHFSDKGEAQQDGIPGVLFRKGGRSLDVLATALQKEGHLPSGDARDLVAALKERRESALHADKGVAAAEEAHHAAAHAQAVDEHASFLQEFEGVDRTTAEAMAQRFLAERVRANLERPLPEAMGAASAGFKGEAAQPIGKQIAAQVKAAARQFVQGVQDFAGRLGGQIAPTLSRWSEDAGNKVARLGAAAHYARLWPSVVLDRVMPAGAGPAERLRLGATMVEFRLRRIRDAYSESSARSSAEGARQVARLAALRQQAGQLRAARPTTGATAWEGRRSELAAAMRQARKAAGEAFAKANGDRDKAAGVVSMVGGRSKDPAVQPPLPDEAAYRAALADPRVRDMIAKHKTEAAPDLMRAYERGTGKPGGEGGGSFLDMPVSLVVPREGEEASATTFVPGTSRGKLGNQKLGRLSASYEATGSSSKGYELDYGKILERMAADRFPMAAKIELFKSLADSSAGRVGKPGEPVVVDGEAWKRLPDVHLERVFPKEYEKGDSAFYVNPKFYDEVHQVLGLNKPPGAVPMASILSKLTLASTVEAAYHSRNLLTMMTRPGFNPLDTFRHARKLVYGDKDAMKAVLALAEIGAMKEHGFEAPVFLGRYNPLARFQAATGQFLTVVDRAIRLSAADAYERVATRPGVVRSEQAKRDFINQAGNYSKLTQSRIVAWLRDTGLGPFATAGSNFYVQGLRGLVGSHGIKTTSYKADLTLRAEMIARMAVLPAIAAAVNYALWGRVDGDDKTPLFGLKIGTDAKGKTSYLDLGGLTGITRGMRETGLQALAESQRPGAKRLGATPSDAFDRGVSDAALAILHPAVGPPVSFAHTALTGKNTLGGQVAPRADLKKGESQAERNLWAALWQTNPVLESYVEPLANEAAGFKEARKDESLQEKAMKMAGPFGVKTRGEPPGAPRRRMDIPVPASPQQRQEQQQRRGLAAPRR